MNKVELFFGENSIDKPDKSNNPLYEELKVPAELNKTRKEIFDWLGLDIITKVKKDPKTNEYIIGKAVRDKKGSIKHFVVSKKEKVKMDKKSYEVVHESDVTLKDIEKYEKYVDIIRRFLIRKYDKENIPIGQNNNDIVNIIRNLRNFNKLDMFQKEVYYLYKGKKILKGYNNSGNSVNNWFPEMVSVRLTKGKDSEHYSIFDQIREKDLFFSKFKRIVVNNKLKIFDDSKIGIERVFDGLGAGLRVVSGAQPVTNIRCTVAKWIWEWSIKELDKNNEFICWDPSMGWAGRMIGFLSASKHIENKRAMYIGTDPNEQIFDRYKKIEGFWKKHINHFCHAEVRPLCIGSEEFHNSDEFKEFKGRGSVVYTSPPYFAKERYSQDEEQSYKKFSEYEDWKSGFLKQTIQNAYDFLMPGGLFFWNIADVYIGSKKMPLEEDSKVLAKEIGFEFQEILYQLMKTFPGRDMTDEMIKKQIEKGSNFVQIRNENAMTAGKQKDKNEIWQKYEPIYVFRKN